LGAADRRAAVPVVLLVDADNRLQRAIVDTAIARETEACLERWRSLRRLAGASNADTAAEVAASAPAVASAGVPQPLPPAEPVVSPPEGRETGAAYIETPRCSSCNECIQLNGRMFKYNENKQAYIADASAGTFRELVEAAESCQVSIIHPGLPLRPDEPGLDALLERAAAFS
jgi:ferredoxin